MDYGLTIDRRIERRLKKIDRDLSVEIVPTPRGPRFAVFHGLQVGDRYDAAVTKLAHEIQAESALNGYIFDFEDCALTARDVIHMGKLVCYVAEDDGSFAPLDGRVVDKLQRMNYLRENWGLKDWRAFLKIKADAMADSQRRASTAIWDAHRRDPVFQRQVSDVLWGLRPARSVIVPDNFTPAGVHHAAPALSS